MALQQLRTGALSEVVLQYKVYAVKRCGAEIYDQAADRRFMVKVGLPLLHTDPCDQPVHSRGLLQINRE